MSCLVSLEILPVSSVDVVVPCYHYGRFLRDCVGSILSQPVDDVRVLVIDNASTDGSVEIASALAQEDDRVSVLARERNLGPHASYNEGIDWARADYFAILDADDVMAPGALQRAMRVLDAHPGVAFVHGRELAAMFPSGAMPQIPATDDATDCEIIGGHAFVDRIFRQGANTVGWTTGLRRTSVQKRAGHYRTSLRFTDDLEMWLRLAMLGDVAEIRGVQGIRRLHPAQDTEGFRRNPTAGLREHIAAFSLFLDDEGAAHPRAAELRREIGRRIGLSAYWQGRGLIGEGRLEQGQDCIDLGLALARGAVVPRVLKALIAGKLPVTGLRRHLHAAWHGPPPVAG